ncbi:MAG: hypothetical protein A3C47_03515 [Omnitrophica bacterium RIFCSPHIGHO2_02_FULL_51_18]|nr:MAG: hypothetical protein A3C47_03515 [Omnitrophica bacterium RIFCSPHIGHO2_02_FULL_51_18]
MREGHLKMKILRNHLLGEFLFPFFGSLFSLVFVFLLGRGVVQMADLIFNKDVNLVLILKMLLHSLPFVLIFLIPMAVLISTLLTFGKLSHDNEIMAVRASGVSLLQMAKPLLAFVFVICLFSLLLSDKIASNCHYTYRLILEQIGMESPSAALEEGTFIKRFKNFVIFIYEIDRSHLNGIRIYQPQEGRPTRTIIAEKGEIISIPEKGLIKLKLVNGTSDEPDPKDPSKLYKLNFKTYDLPLNVSALRESEKLGKKPKDMTIHELSDEIKRLGEAGITATYPLSTEIHNKIALAFSSLAFILIGIPLGITSRRAEKSISFGLSLALMVLYWVLLIGGKALAQKGLAPPFLALQFSNLVVGGLGAFFFVRLQKN